MALGVLKVLWAQSATTSVRLWAVNHDRVERGNSPLTTIRCLS